MYFDATFHPISNDVQSILKALKRLMLLYTELKATKHSRAIHNGYHLANNGCSVTSTLFSSFRLTRRCLHKLQKNFILYNPSKNSKHMYSLSFHLLCMKITYELYIVYISVMLSNCIRLVKQYAKVLTNNVKKMLLMLLVFVKRNKK